MKAKTKAQKEEEAKDALYQRVRDMAWGAAGYAVHEEDQTICLAVAARLIPVLREAFRKDGNEYLFDPHNLDEYETVEKAVGFLFRHGVRA